MRLRIKQHPATKRIGFPVDTGLTSVYSEKMIFTELPKFK